MRATVTIATNTVREALRERLLYNLVVFAILLVAGSLTISNLTIGEQYRIIANIGTSATQVFGTLIAVFLGVGLVSKEMDRRTCYPVLARPVSRAGFVVGKYVGLLATLVLNVVLMAAALVAVLLTYRGEVGIAPAAFVATFGLMLLQFAICGALAVLFSTFTTATLASIFSLALIAAAWAFSEVRPFWIAAPQAGMKELVAVLDLVLPNMALLDLKEAVTYGDPVAAGSTLIRALYGAAYAATIVALGALVFSRKDVR